MTEPVTPSQLRQNIYRLIDHVIETGDPLEIKRRGHRLVLALDEARADRLAAIHTNPEAIAGDPEDLVSMDWSAEWDADRQVRP